MANYAGGVYGGMVYSTNGATLTPADAVSLNFTDAFLRATVLSNTTIRLDWNPPSATHYSRVLVRSTLGFVPDPVSSQGVSLLYVPDATSTSSDNYSIRTLNDRVAPGTEVYYTLFVLVDPDSRTSVSATSSGLSRAWLPVAQVSVITDIDHDAFQRLRSSIPAAFLSENSAEVLGTETANSDLSRTYLGLADVLDPLLTRVDLLNDAWNLQKTPAALVNPLSQTVGMPLEPALGPKPQRRLVNNSTRILSGKGTRDSVELVAQCVSGVDATSKRGKNLFPGIQSSGFENHTTVGSRLMTPVSVSDTQIVVDSTAGWPITLNRNGVLRQNFWIIVRGAGGTEPMLVTGVVGTTLTVERGTAADGRFASPQLANPAGSTVVVDVTWSGWSLSPGYDAKVVGQGDTGFGMPTTQMLYQPPLVSKALALTRSGNSVAPPSMSYGQRRFVADYSRRGTTGTITTWRPHGLTTGQRIRAMFGGASVVPNTAAKYNVTSIQDAYRFTIQHREPVLVDADLAPSDTSAASPPYVDVLPHPVSTLPVTAGIPYTFSMYVRASTTSRSVTPSVTWYDATGEQVSVTVIGTATSDAVGSWTRVSVTAVPPAGAVLAGVFLTWSVVWAAGETHYVTQAQFEQSLTPTAYDDGGLIQVGLLSLESIDPTKTIRTRLRSMLSEHLGAERRYRTAFMDSYMTLLATDSITTTAGTAGSGSTNWASVNLDLRMRVSFNTAAATTLFTATQVSTGKNWTFGVNGTRLVLSNTFAAGSVTSSVYTLTPNTSVWLRVTRSATGVVAFYTAPDSQSVPTVWNALGTGTSTGWGTTDRLSITGAGKVFLAQMIDGSKTVAEMNPSRFNPFTDLVVNGGASGGPTWDLSNDIVYTTEFPKTLFP